MIRETHNKCRIREIIALVAVGLALMSAAWLFSTESASAQTTYTEGALYYTVSDESITITGYFGKDASVTVPSIIAGTPVNTIATGAFANTAATTVYLPDTITTIEEGAFTVGTSIVSNYNTETPTTEEAGESEESGGTGADYGNTEEGDTVVVGDKEMTVTSNEDGRITLVDAEGRTYHSNGSYIIDDETHKPLEGDVRITHKDGTEEAYTTLDDTEENTNRVSTATIVIIVLAVIILAVAAVLIYRKKKAGNGEVSNG